VPARSRSKNNARGFVKIEKEVYNKVLHLIKSALISIFFSCSATSFKEAGIKPGLGYIITLEPSIKAPFSLLNASRSSLFNLFLTTAGPVFLDTIIPSLTPDFSFNCGKEDAFKCHKTMAEVAFFFPFSKINSNKERLLILYSLPKEKVFTFSRDKFPSPLCSSGGENFSSALCFHSGSKAYRFFSSSYIWSICW